MTEDDERRRRRRAKEMYAEDRAQETKRSETRPTLAPSRYYARSDKRRTERDSPESTTAESGRKPSVRIDPNLQISDGLMSPTTPSRGARPVPPSRPSRSDQRERTRDWPLKDRESAYDDSQGYDYRRDDGGRNTREITSLRTEQAKDGRPEEIRRYDDYKDGTLTSSRRGSPDGGGREYDERTEGSGSPDGARSRRREGGYFEVGPMKGQYRDYRDNMQRTPRTREDETLRPGSGSRRTSDYYGRPPTDRRPDDGYDTGRHPSYASRDNRDEETGGWQTTLALRPSGRDSSPLRETLKRSSLKERSLPVSRSYRDDARPITESDRLSSLKAWRDDQLDKKHDLCKKLREDLKTSFKTSSDSRDRGKGDEGWADEYKWSHKDALNEYRKGKQGLDDICSDFKERYKDTVCDVYDRYARDPRRGLPEESSSVEGTVHAEEKRQGLYIQSTYTYTVGGNKEARDDFHLWFPSRRISDNLGIIVKEVGRKLLKAT